MRKLILQPKSERRRGAAAVEFALLAPVFVAMAMGAIQAGYNFDNTNKMLAVIRQSGRLASMDANAPLQPGQTLNQKVIQDIKNSLTANGLPGNQMTVTITNADGASAGSTFDLSNSNNYLQYFKITVSVPYSAVNTGNFLPSSNSNMSASVVFRMGQSSLVN